MNEINIVGREREIELLDEIIQSSKAELVAVYGRRRVGKTFLLRTYLQQKINFQFSGLHHVDTEVQLQNFTKALSIQLNNKIPLEVPDNWFTAFDLLQALLAKKMRLKKVVLFLDEFPWLQTPKSNFIAAFENFWNNWASTKNNVVVILCGSAASWMIKNIVRNKGGLHNRITRKMPLQPFTLHETEQFLKKRNVHLNRFQIIQLYMAIGGIPLYLENVKPGLSTAQIIEQECFSKNGLLYNEFNDLYKALFDDAEKHLKVVKALAAKPNGMMRNELIKACKFQSGGTITELLDELSASNFISAYIPYGKKSKDAIYKLTDAYSLFYLKFIEPKNTLGKGSWQKIADTQTWKIWSGLAFETLCIQHHEAIKVALGIQGIYTEVSAWKDKNSKGKSTTQIDMLIDRRDGCINICEMKFYDNTFVIDKKYAENLRNKKTTFKSITKTRKQLFFTLVTTYGLKQNEHSIGLIEQAVTINDLFRKISF